MVAENLSEDKDVKEDVTKVMKDETMLRIQRHYQNCDSPCVLALIQRNINLS